MRSRPTGEALSLRPLIPLWDSLARRRRAGVTASVVSVLLVVFAVQCVLLVLAPATFERLLQTFALVPEHWWRDWASWRGWWPLLTCTLLHGSVLHVAGNAWFLWVFGRSLEPHLGSARFLGIYLIGAVGAGLAQIAVEPGSGVPVIGASGAISAVMGAYFVRLPTRWIVSLVPWVVPILPVPAFVFLLLWFFLQVWEGIGSLGGTATGGVAWWAHAGGFVAGAGLALLLPVKAAGGAKPRRRRT